ncbi:MAG TPA: MBOAT family O-acyltransferase [Coriobacteriia bacterium]
MIFGEWIYAVFLAVAALVYRFVPARARGWWISGCGLAFYAYYSPAFVWLIVAEIVIVLLLVKQARRHVWAYAAALVVAIGVLGLYKYGLLVSTTASQAATALRLGTLPTFPQLVLPLAISFFTFEFVHYIVDARAGRLPEHSASDFFAFALFFPTMVAGPIKRFQDFKPQIGTSRASAQDVNDGATRIAIGLAKKICIADTVTPLTASLLTTQAMRGATNAQLIIGLLAFAVRIYMDFSGYSDIAIGSARLFGIHVPENFDWPYIRSSIAQFWRHWHMSLTSWITDYVYIPLGGNRRGLALTALNSVLAMAVSGIWHGAQWHFLVWGIYHGVLLAVYRLWVVLVKTPLVARFAWLREGPVAGATRALGYAVGAVTTFAAVTLGWGLFVMPVERFVEMLGRFA